jgi:hypothetical protein
MYVGDKPVGLKMSAAGKKVAVTVYVRSQLTKDEENILETDIALGLGEDEDLNTFYSFAHSDDVLSVVVIDLYR